MQAADDATTLRTRTEELAGQLSARAEELSARTAERDAARTALLEYQAQAKTLERVLIEQRTELAGELETVQAKLRESEKRNEARTAEQHAQTVELRTRIAEAQAESAALRSELMTTTARLTRSTEDREHVLSLLSRVRRRAVAAATETPTPLRDDLLAILLEEAFEEQRSGKRR
jgi:chromosome segregation ATPase